MKRILPYLVLTVFFAACMPPAALPTATPTPDIAATVEAMVKAQLTAIAPTATPVPTPTPIPTPTPTMTPSPVPLPVKAQSRTTCNNEQRFSVAAGSSRWFDIPLQQGERVQGSLVIEAGSNVDFSIQDGFGNIIREGGRVEGSRSFDFRADVQGTYRLVFSNRYSFFSNKLVHIVYSCSV